MKKSNANYDLTEKLHESSSTLVYRAVQIQDHVPVILKVLQPANPAPEELSRFQCEYDITQSFNNDGIIRVFRMEAYHNTLMIIQEDIAAESLDILMKRRSLTLEECLFLAVRTAENVGHIHAANVIHKNLNPSNIVWNPETDQVKIIDFGIASRLPSENFTLRNPGQLEGTLAYLSPEQTGRINRSIDYRTDLYSLGVTFYEMLCGQLPFATTNRVELVHCHIAKKPSPVCEINADIPPIVSDIIVKLLEKNAEDRYQSALGLKVDLEKCQEHLANKQNITDLQFELGQNDFSGQFQISQKLYGRDNEINTLLETFDRVSLGNTEMILVAGYSGVGKTALVHEVHKPMTENRGYFIAGKFDQFKRNIPYYAITQAFSEFCRSLLRESSRTLQNLQNKILDAVGKNGQVIIDVIPDLELIIGKQPAVAQLDPTEAQNRFLMYFLNFVKAVCDKDHPFILFIDDFQWIDSASLTLLNTIMLDGEIRHLLIIGAYRDNEVDSNHPFIMAVDKLKKANTVVVEIGLTNLQSGDINHLLQDSFGGTAERYQPLTDLIYQKTQGNAFFTHQFLQTLYEEKFFRFNLEQHQWQWEIKQIAAQNITENIVDLMAGKIANLPKKTSAVLKLAACVGNQFDLSMLAVINEESINETLSVMWDAIVDGIIQPLDENYKHLDTKEKSQFKFLHDRVQQAAYALIDDKQKQGFHLRIGRLLLKNIPVSALADKVFDIVGQFNHSLELLTNPTERLEIVRLNLMAGKKAKTATAYEAAAQYLNLGIKHLPGNSWQNHYELTFELFRQCAECEYLLTHAEQSEKLFHTALENTRTDLEKAEIYAMLITHSMALSKLDEALERGRQGLCLCGVDFPAEELMSPAIQNESNQLVRLMKNKKISTLIDAPQMVDESKMIAMSIFPNLTLAGYLSGNYNLFTLSVLMSTNLSLANGQLDLSAYTYAFYGILLSTQGRLKEAYEFGKLSLKLSDTYPNCREKSQVHNIVGTFLTHLSQHIKSGIPVLTKGYQTGFEVGDVLPAVFCFHNISIQMFAAGETLPNMSTYLKKAIHITYKNKVFISGDIAVGYQQLVQFLITGDAQFAITDDTFENEQLQRIKSSNSIAFIMHTRLHKAFWFSDYKEALELANKAEKTLEFIPGYIMTFEHYFLYALTLSAIYNDVSEIEKEEYLQKIELCEQKLKIWAENCPENFLHRYLLIRAEKARITNNEMDAVGLYDQAIHSAAENEFVQNAALGNELAVRFWLDNGKGDFAVIYLREALYLYDKWGAIAKVRELEVKYTQLLAPATGSNLTSTKTVTGSSISQIKTSIELDLESVMKASHILSGEIVLSRLLKKMMHLVIENAGATRGLLILEKDGQWMIEAEGFPDVDEVTVMQALPIEESEQVPATLINYISHTRENVVLSDATGEDGFTKDAYIIKKQPKSVLGLPLLNHGILNGILYLENNLTTGAFTTDRLQVITLLAFQAGISLENARLFEEKQKYAEELVEEVSERKQAEEALLESKESLRKSEERYRSLINATASIIWTTDASGGFVEPQFSWEKFTGQPWSEQKGFGWGEKIHPDDIKRVLEIWRKACEELSLYETWGRVWNANLKEWRNFEVKAVPIINQDGSLREWVGIITDVTERKRAEKEKRNLQTQLQQALKMEAMGTLAGGIAHDFNNLLMAIQGRASIMLMNKESSHLDFRHLKGIEDNIESAADLTRQLLGFARGGKYEVKPTDLNEVVKKQNRMFGRTKKEITIRGKYEENPWSVDVDRGQIEQVLLNLYVNAWQAMPAGGDLYIETQNITLDENYTKPYQVEPGSYVQTSITDTGTGMDKITRERIFEPFFTTKEMGRGTGLGLASAYGIIKNHGGFINVLQ